MTGPNCSTEINECDKNFCVASTTLNCTDLEGDYTCDCMLGYEGKNCSDATCADSQCRNGSTCTISDTDWGTEWVCQCLPFYGGEIWAGMMAFCGGEIQADRWLFVELRFG